MFESSQNYIRHYCLCEMDLFKSKIDDQFGIKLFRTFLVNKILIFYQAFFKTTKLINEMKLLF